MILDIWLPELGENQCVLCSGTWFVVTCRSSPWMSWTLSVCRGRWISTCLSPVLHLLSALASKDTMGQRAEGREAGRSKRPFTSDGLLLYSRPFMVLCGTNHQVTGRALVAGLGLSQKQGSLVRAEAWSVCARQPCPHLVRLCGARSNLAVNIW